CTGLGRQKWAAFPWHRSTLTVRPSYRRGVRWVGVSWLAGYRHVASGSGATEWNRSVDGPPPRAALRSSGSDPGRPRVVDGAQLTSTSIHIFYRRGGDLSRGIAIDRAPGGLTRRQEPGARLALSDRRDGGIFSHVGKMWANRQPVLIQGERNSALISKNYLAETVGFEPTEECKPLSTLAGWCTRPNYATSPVFVSNHSYQPDGSRIGTVFKNSIV
ncbi:MAG: hypothetical protein JWR36_962, partial [Glaciihabitans sp.]|nr:hypothetical protein [Glaciihabitans sp.]